MPPPLFNERIANSLVGSKIAADRVFFSKYSRSRQTTTYKVGIETFGLITGVSNYGLFIRLPNGESGLVFKNAICWPGENITHAVGDRVRVKVVGFKIDRGLALSIRDTRKDFAFNAFCQDFPVGTHLNGKIKGILDYGVFVTVAPGVVGLVHISGIPDMAVYGKESIGSTIDVSVLGIEYSPNRLRLGLA